MAVGAFALVAVVHAAAVLLLVTRMVQIVPPAEKQRGGPLRVRLVSTQPVPAVAAPLIPPPEPVRKPAPEPQTKVMASEAPSARKVEQPKKVVQEQPKVAHVEPVVSPPPQTPPAQPVAAPAQAPAAAEAPVMAKPAAGTGNPDLVGAGAQAAPKEVGQLACRIPKPEYPRAARRQGQSGQVTVRLVVNELGRVAAAEVTRGSGFPMLDEAARNAALSGSCEPYREGGHAIRVTALQLFNFVPSD